MKKPNPAVVRRIEQRLSKHIIDGVKCPSECRCEECIQKYLDSILAKYEPALVTAVGPLEIERFID